MRAAYFKNLGLLRVESFLPFLAIKDPSLFCPLPAR